jgi:hypothetical protein
MFKKTISNAPTAKTYIVLITLFLVGCATQLKPGANKIRSVGIEQKGACESLGIVVDDQQLGPYKTQNSTNKALNEVVKRGGNAIYIIANAPSGLDGVSVTAEALRCN